jgi:hypothetical protein
MTGRRWRGTAKTGSRGRGRSLPCQRGAHDAMMMMMMIMMMMMMMMMTLHEASQQCGATGGNQAQAPDHQLNPSS